MFGWIGVLWKCGCSYILKFVKKCSTSIFSGHFTWIGTSQKDSFIRKCPDLIELVHEVMSKKHAELGIGIAETEKDMKSYFKYIGQTAQRKKTKQSAGL